MDQVFSGEGGDYVYSRYGNPTVSALEAALLTIEEGKVSVAYSSGMAAIHAALDDHSRVTLHDYAGLDHGFAAEMGERRHEAGARLADSRTEAFLKEHLA